MKIWQTKKGAILKQLWPVAPHSRGIVQRPSLCKLIELQTRPSNSKVSHVDLQGTQEFFANNVWVEARLDWRDLLGFENILRALGNQAILQAHLYAMNPLDWYF